MKGERRYMKIQKPGRVAGVARTLRGLVSMGFWGLCVAWMEMAYPQKINVREKRSCAMFPAVSADSIPATTMSVNVDVKSKNTQT